jgi:endonuclease-3
MKITEKNNILTFLDARYPHVGCELWYKKDYQLLIAVVLSAQTTDRAVNRVTPKLFKKFPSLQALANASVSAIATIIQSIGLYHTKAKHIQSIAQQLVTSYQGQVPSDKAQLLSLPGVGVKTANVVRAELFKIPEIAVDTHVHRIAIRLGFAKPGDDVFVVEKKLRRALPEHRYILTHHQFIHFGRYFCQARKPLCDGCPLVKQCHEKNKNLKE